MINENTTTPIYNVLKKNDQTDVKGKYSKQYKEERDALNAKQIDIVQCHIDKLGPYDRKNKDGNFVWVSETWIAFVNKEEGLKLEVSYHCSEEAAWDCWKDYLRKMK
jgi:hypothetical protein